ncbi:MAG: hypothetical protein R2776_07705 [Flavobacteriaceae bacterium]
MVTSGDFVVEDSEKENVEKPQDTTNVLIKKSYVTDESNLALPGVNIIIKGTTINYAKPILMATIVLKRNPIRHWSFRM